MTPGQRRTLIGYSLIFLLTLFISACGGSDPSAPRERSNQGLNGGQDVTAVPGAIYVIVKDGTVNLNGRDSTTASGASMSFAWSFTYKPDDSVTELQNATTETPSFVGDAVGTYMIQLLVTADGVESRRAVAIVEVVLDASVINANKILSTHDVNKSSVCVSCHNGVTNTAGKRDLPKPSTHVATSNTCQACHSVAGFAPVPFVDHFDVFGSCNSCHDGDSPVAVTKSNRHIETTAECSDCHNTDSFVVLDINGNYDHTGVVRGCVACHTGVVARGKDAGVTTKAIAAHEKTTADCFQCHITASFIPATDHTDIANGCARCHGEIFDANGAAFRDRPEVTSKSSNHPVITLSTVVTEGEPVDVYDCNICHSTRSFVLAADRGFNHRVVDYRIQSCVSCHSNGNNTPTAIGTATKTNPAHIDIPPFNGKPADCGMCHRTSNKSYRVDPRDIVGFKPAFTDHTSIEVTGVFCSTCHNGSVDSVSGLVMRGIPQSGHIVSLPNEDCKECHQPPGGTFSTGFFAHTQATRPITNACIDCHNGDISVGISGNHIPTDRQCDICHTDTKNYTTFVGAGYHANNTVDANTTCASCHDGLKSTGLSKNHLPVDQGLDCGDCHSVPTNGSTFKGANYHSAGRPTNTPCADCHNDSIAIGKKYNKIIAADPSNIPIHIATGTNYVPPHLPALDNCKACHDTADRTTPPARSNFINSKFAHVAVDGNPITRGCGGCHIGKIVMNRKDLSQYEGRFVTLTSTPISKYKNHVPTNQDCNVCHSGFGSFIPTSTYAHVGISGNCVSCHDGNFFTKANARGKANMPPPKTHLATTADCGICHSYSKKNFSFFFVDHNGPAVVGVTCESCHKPNGNVVNGAATPKNATHLPTTQDCGLCHVPGTFIPAVFNHTGIVDKCITCHKPGGASSKFQLPPPAHVQTTEDCVLCHNTTTFAGAKFNHKGITNNCVTCHDGVTALGKSNAHVPTTIPECEVCHVVTGFVPATFDHTGITNNCTSCHDGVFATGKTQTHVVTNGDCVLCHSQKGWIPATFDHSAANVPTTKRCDSCHNDSIAVGKTRRNTYVHAPTTLDCRNCHTTLSFLGATWTHDASAAGNCKNCHVTGGGATPQPTTGHFVTTANAQCDDCHTTKGWAQVTNYVHSSAAYPSNHTRILRCKACHINSTNNVTYRDDPTGAKYGTSCAACHARNFQPEGDHIGGNAGTVKQNQNCGASGCHGVGRRGF